jgi:hypothetical protein
MNGQSSMLMGAVGMASFVAALFFLRFWRQTRDEFFLLFACAFAIDSISRFTIGWTRPSAELEPLLYLLRLATFGLIIVAIILKNRPKKPGE